MTSEGSRDSGVKLEPQQQHENSWMNESEFMLVVDAKNKATGGAGSVEEFGVEDDGV